MFGLYQPVPPDRAPLNDLPISTEPALGASLAARVARVLDNANVPSLLWGFLAVALIEEDRNYPEIEFVIADANMQHAIKTLNADGIRPCDEPKCRELLTDTFDGYDSDDSELDLEFSACDHHHPVGAAHYHFKARFECLDDSCRSSRHPLDEHGQYFHEQFLVMHLLRQSQVLSWLEPLKPGLALPLGNDHHPHLMLSNDPSLPARVMPRPPSGEWMEPVTIRSGPWTELYPVRILRPRSYIESVIWLMCRDMDVDEIALQSALMRGWSNLATALQSSPASVSDRFRSAWAEMIGGHGKFQGPAVLALRDDLIRSGKLSIPWKGQ